MVGGGGYFVPLMKIPFLPFSFSLLCAQCVTYREKCYRRGLVRSLSPDVLHQAASEVRSRHVTACKRRVWNFAPLNVRQNLFHGRAISVGVSICSIFNSHAFIRASPLEYAHLPRTRPRYILQKHLNQLHLGVVQRLQSLSKKCEQSAENSREDHKDLSSFYPEHHIEVLHVPSLVDPSTCWPSQKRHHSIWDLEYVTDVFSKSAAMDGWMDR